MIINFSKYAKSLSDEIEDKKAIFDIVIRSEVENTIKEAGLDPELFTLNKDSEQDFFKRPFVYTQEDDSFGDIYYDLVLPDTIFRCSCRITLFQDGQKVESETDIYRLENYKKGNREWEYFNGEDWEEGPGKDFFDFTDFEKN